MKKPRPNALGLCKHDALVGHNHLDNAFVTYIILTCRVLFRHVMLGHIAMLLLTEKSQRRLNPISLNDAKPIVSQVNNSAYAQVWRKLVGI